MPQGPENVGAAETGNHQDQPQSAPTQPTGVSNFVDGSEPIFSMYMEMASEEDKKMAEGWKADADGILIFTGLFSAAVASLISVSIQDIRPNPQDTSNFYLANIYQTVSDPNRSNTSTSLPSSPPPFSPPVYAVWVNSLWFLSLVISLTCALLATLLQQWARRYLKVTQPRYSPQKRARIRAFFAEGVDKFLLSQAVEVLPTLLHISLFLFFAGLLVFLWNVYLTIFKVVLSLVSVCTAVYGCITVMPLLFRDSPYSTPLTSLVWPIIIWILDVIFHVVPYLIWSHRVGRLKDKFHKMRLQGMQKTAEETAPNLSSAVDTRAFLWTFDTSDEDHELERFFSGLPGFRSSKVIDDPLPGLTPERKEKLSMALIGLLDRTFSSTLLSDSAKSRRAVICARAIDPTHTPMAFVILDKILSNYQNSDSLTAEIIHIVRGWGSDWGEDTNPVARAAACSITTRARRDDDSWFVLASNGLGVPESVLRSYAPHSDSLSLAILIHLTRQQFRHLRTQFWPWDEFSNVLQAASRFNVQDTSPELQHEFCKLWNQIVLKVRNDNDRWMAFHTLRPIRNIYVALHRDTTSSPTEFSAATGDQDDVLWRPLSYPSCNATGHIHDESTSTTLVCPVPHDDAVQAPVSIASPNAPPSPMPAPRHVNEALTINDNIYGPGSSNPTHRTDLCPPSASPDPVTVRAIQGGIDIPTTTIPFPTAEPSTSAPPPLASTFPGGFVDPHIIDCRTSSDVLDVSLPPSPTPVLDNIPSTGIHSSLLAPAAPAAPGTSSPQPLFSSDLGATIEGEGSTGAALPPSAIRENTMAASDLPPQMPLPPSVTDPAISSPSWRSLVPHHSHDQYNIV
ncbi:hypothetical protein EDB87DRAFT_1418172 [Lactarius vividus]|nr:hypothetical protein EDB87DRAFT_1418172 [Lactarius vividus]